MTARPRLSLLALLATCFAGGVGLSATLMRTYAGPMPPERGVGDLGNHGGVAANLATGRMQASPDHAATDNVTVSLEPAEGVLRVGGEETPQHRFPKNQFIGSTNRTERGAASLPKNTLPESVRAELAAGTDGRRAFFSGTPAYVTTGGYVSYVEAETKDERGLTLLLCVTAKVRVSGGPGKSLKKRREVWLIEDGTDAVLLNAEAHPDSVDGVYLGF